MHCDLAINNYDLVALVQAWRVSGNEVRARTPVGKIKASNSAGCML